MKRSAHIVVLVVAMLVGTRARAEVRSFAPGSLIIPMDQCYQAVNGPSPTGWTSGVCGSIAAVACYNQGTSYPAGDIPHVFGVLYLLLLNNVPVRLAMNPTKLSLSDPDFTVNSNAGQPATVLLRYANGTYTADPTAMNNGTHPVPYAGSAFIVDAPYTTKALSVLGAFNARWSALLASVNVHMAQNDFTAPIATTLASRPKPAGIINGSGLEGYFQMTGIPSVVGNGDATAGGAGNSYVLITQSASGAPSYVWKAAPPGACDSAGNCSSFTYAPPGSSTSARILDVVWASGSAVANWSSLANNGLNQLLSVGGRVLATDQAAVIVENGASGSAALHYLTSSGLTGLSNGQSNGPYCAGALSGLTAVSGNALAPAQYPAANPYLIVGNEAFTTVGNGQSSAYSFSGAPFRDGVQALASSYRGGVFPVVVGHPTLPGSTTPASGMVIYEGGGNAWNLTSFKDAGLHVMYDTLLNAGDAVGDNGLQWTPVELTHASPVADPYGSPKFYLGSFEWSSPANPAVAGNMLWRPPVTRYPTTLGHFREYVGTASSSLGCAGGNCNWDAATAIAAQGARTILVPVQQNGQWTLVDASTLTATDPALKYVLTTIGGKLGGIDYSTAAVVQPKGRGSLVTVANAPNRPTIAYVGAADGMLHAICVSSSCYGKSQGQEIWAIIPPAMRAQMQAAYAAGDWTQVKLDGAMRVADSFDKLDPTQPQTPVYRTVLVAGMRTVGAVVAIDISDPSPANLNQAGFRFLWQNDGTTVDSSVTCPASGCGMGVTLGATLAKPSTANTLVAIATSATPAKPAGVNTYYLRLSDGKVMKLDQLLYTRLIALPAGAHAVVPNDPPAMPTVLDADGDGSDETLYVADYEGRVRRFSLTTTGFTSATTVLDGTNGCASGYACQPIATSPAIARTGTSPTAPTYAAIVATGGADWARATPTPTYLVAGIDGAATSTATPLVFQRSLVAPTTSTGMLTLPTGETLPLRVYGQPTISGSDLWVQATTLAVNSISQLLFPIMYPATAPQAYGMALRWHNVATTLEQTPTAFASTGGAASVIVTGSYSSPGAIDVVGGSYINSYVTKLGDTSVPNTVYTLAALGTQRMFKTMSWFDLSE